MEIRETYSKMKPTGRTRLRRVHRVQEDLRTQQTPKNVQKTGNNGGNILLWQ